MKYDIFDFQPDFTDAPKQRTTTVTDVLNHAAAPLLLTWPDTQPERSFVWRINLETRAERQRLLEFFSKKGGRQKPLLIPTWDNEFAIVGSPASGSSTVQIQVASFPCTTTYDDETGRFIWMADPVGGLFVSRVLSGTGSSPVTLTLEERLPFTPSPETIMGYAAMVRFDQDEIEMRITSRETSEAEVAFRTIHHQTQKGEAFDLGALDEVYETLPFTYAEQAYGDAPFLDSMISVALGPDVLSTIQSAQFLDGWVAWVSDGGVRLIKGNRSTITRPANSSGAASGLFTTRPDTTHISLAFDQVSREVIAYQKDATTIGVRRWVSLAMSEVQFPGISPQLFFNGVLDPAAKAAGESDIICFYFKHGDGLIYARASRDNFDTEYQFAPLCSEASRFLYLETDPTARRALLVVIDTHWRLCTYRSAQYPVP